MTETLVRPDVRAFLDMLRAKPRPQMDATNIAAMRPMAPAGMAMLEPPVGELAVLLDVEVPGPAGPIPTRMFDARAERSAGPVVIFFHGGGYVIGCIDTHVSMCAEISRALDMPVISIDYRLAPEHPWPAAPDDAEAAVRWIAENGAAFERSFTGLVLCGDSAGGNLTIVTTLALRNVPTALPVMLQVALYPAVDPSSDYPSRREFAVGYGLDATESVFYFEAYRADASHWRGAPIKAELAGLPPTLIVTAGLDPLRDQGRAYAAKAIEAGVTTTYIELAGTIHGCLGFRRVIPSAQQDLSHVLTAAKRMLEAQAR